MNRDNKGRFVTGHKPTKEMNEKNRSSHLGKRVSPNTEFKKGYRPWNTGKLVPERSGAKNNLWKGGVTKLQKAIRCSAKYKDWRRSVFERDSYTCQSCYVMGGYLHADHKRMLALLIKENNILSLTDAINCAAVWEIDNGRTLCEPCHRDTDTFGPRGKMLLGDLLSANKIQVVKQ